MFLYSKFGETCNSKIFFFVLLKFQSLNFYIIISSKRLIALLTATAADFSEIFPTLAPLIIN